MANYHYQGKEGVINNIQYYFGLSLVFSVFCLLGLLGIFRFFKKKQVINNLNILQLVFVTFLPIFSIQLMLKDSGTPVLSMISVLVFLVGLIFLFFSFFVETDNKSYSEPQKKKKIDKKEIKIDVDKFKEYIGNSVILVEESNEEIEIHGVKFCWTEVSFTIPSLTKVTLIELEKKYSLIQAQDKRRGWVHNSCIKELINEDH